MMEPPGFFRFLLGGLIMVFGVILPLAYMMFQRNKKGIMFLHKQTGSGSI